MGRLKTTGSQHLNSDSIIEQTYLSKLAVGGRVGGVDGGEGIKEGDRIGEVEVGRGDGTEKTVPLITGI